MDKEKELLKYPIKNKYTLLGMEFLRLHNHGQSLIIRTKFSDSFKKHNYDFLIDSLLNFITPYLLSKFHIQIF